MKYRAGFLKVVCACVVILTQSLDAGHVPKKHAASVPCSPRDLAALTRSRVKESLTDFEEANGKHLGTWPPGFPELQVHQNSPLDGSKVQCGLLFMAQGLEEVLEDQRKNLNPKDVSLHKKLRDTISTVNMLAACVKETFKWECSLKPSPPEMPTYAFERKQWSHTLLKTAKEYLGWLESKLIKVQNSKINGKNKIKHIATKETFKKYFEGSGKLL
ncbi:uncharacterized protein LOC119891985 [Micropterus salmoides]|uniref:uncharacterized protein LOC119891985 n=1 Tax=Micropterus salmoides TaxID=27706 RepID=UPI0018EAF991|nr:uncharacterized protein LOC119891985 [Micropterus salmoides]